ncbi:MAG: hypothetical protein U5K76_07965 [Woeseiaceae bacterium]|nr:hypothetical protein [Woeseiaceae bacterium]
MAAAAAAAWFLWLNLRGKPAPTALKPGAELPVRRRGRRRQTGPLDGPARCTRRHPVRARQLVPVLQPAGRGPDPLLQEIVAAGARLVFVTPKPLATTRRVAEFFEVDFEFWLDPDQRIASALGLVHRAGVPGKHRDTHGTDTIWPTALVVDRDGRIVHAEQSRYIADRPDPRRLLQQLEALAD